MKLFRALATVAGLTLVSRVLGFVRDMALASVLGAGMVSDAFFVAMKLPNFFRRMTAEGAFSVSFVPIYARLKERAGVSAAMGFANNALAGMTIILGIFCVVCMLGMPVVVQGLAPGFVTEGTRFVLAVEFSRITFPFLLMASIAALMGGVLNAHNSFAPFASASIILNGMMLLFLVALTPFIGGNAGSAVSWGITVSGLAQVVFLWWCAKRQGLHFKIARPRFTPETRELLNKMGPGVLAAGVVQINLFVDVILASMLGTGAISYLYYADRLNQLPLGLVGVAIATTLLPMLASAIAREDKHESISLFSRSLEFALVLTVPAALALLILAHPIISTLFEMGEFKAHDATTTAQVLQAYSLGLIPFVLSKVFTTAFFARQDTLTPVKVGIVNALINIVLCLILMQFMGVVGIALATSIAAWVQIVTLYYLLHKRGELDIDARMKRHAPLLVYASAVMGAILCLSFLFPVMYDASEKIIQAALLVAVCGVGGLVYLGMIWKLKVITPTDFKAFFTKPPKVTEANAQILS
jgi:putative peptidoglycan lipid II flippase